jgi:hypothetical protein
MPTDIQMGYAEYNSFKTSCYQNNHFERVYLEEPIREQFQGINIHVMNKPYGIHLQ